MSTARRWMSIPVAGAGLVLLGAGVVAGGFAAGLMPGNSKSGDQIISASFIDAQGNTVTIQALTGLTSFRARGGALVSEDTTTVFVEGFTASGLYGSGCWTVSSPPFTIRPSDNSATLSFDSSATGVAPCPGQLVAPGGTIQQSLTPLSLNEGVNGGVVLTAQWAPSGVPTNARFNQNTTCGPFGAVSESQQVWQDSSADAQIASFAVDGVDADGNPVHQSFAGSYHTGFGVVEVASVTQTVNGPSTGSCGPFGSDQP